MSSIHEALKKAQKERDDQYRTTIGESLAGQQKRLRYVPRRPAFWLPLVLIVFIVFGVSLYSRMDFGASQTKAVPQSPVKKPAVPKKQAPEKGVRDFFSEGVSLQKEGRLGDARRLYEKALRMDPGFVDALNNLGVICIREKDYPTAQRSFEKAIRLRPGYVDPYYNLSCLHALKGELSQSLAHLKRAVSLNRSVRDWARGDTDLKNLWGVPEFRDLVGAPGRS
jgi:tetratricopeptide (TPR) repeat protein